MAKKTPAQIERRASDSAVIAAGEDRRVRFLASSAAPDRHGTVVIPAGIKTANFAANPVFAWAHQTGGWNRCEPDDVIGKVVEFEITDRGLEIVAEFAAADVSPKAERAYRMVQAGLLNAVSIGFAPTSYHYEKRDGDYDAIIFDEVDLLEVSLVIVGSNPEALALRSLFPSRPAMKRELLLKRLGLTGEPTRAEVRAALLRYLATTSDDASQRGAVARACEEMDGEDRADGTDDDTAAEDRADDADADADADAEKDSDDDKAPDDEDRAALVAANELLREGLKRQAAEAPKREGQIGADVDKWIAEGRIPREKRDKYIAMHRDGKAAGVMKHIPRGTFTAARRLRSGVVGTEAEAPPAPAKRNNSEVADKATSIMNNVGGRLGAVTRSN